MPVKRTLAKRRRCLDPYKIQQLMSGPREPVLSGEGYQGHATDEMRRDWEENRDRLLRWWVFNEDEPPMKLWTFVGTPNPKTRPWAWWQFDAPQDAKKDEAECEYLERLGLLLPGEAELPTYEERQAAQDANIEAEIAANLAKIGLGRRS